MNTALEYSTRVIQEGGRRCKKSTLNDLVHLADLLTDFAAFCLTDFIDWRYIHSRFVRPSL
jgi:hypothetical protein